LNPTGGEIARGAHLAPGERPLVMLQQQVRHAKERLAEERAADAGIHLVVDRRPCGLAEKRKV
jgi:hypothetical protein